MGCQHDIIDIERIARDAVRALAPYDPDLARSFRHQLSSTSTLRIATIVDPALKLARLQRAVESMLQNAKGAPSDVLAWLSLDELRLALR